MTAQMAACENCGRVRPISLLQPVEFYTFERQGGGRPTAVFDGQRMYCPPCRRDASDPDRGATS